MRVRRGSSSSTAVRDAGYQAFLVRLMNRYAKRYDRALRAAIDAIRQQVTAEDIVAALRSGQIGLVEDLYDFEALAEKLGVVTPAPFRTLARTAADHVVDQLEDIGAAPDRDRAMDRAQVWAERYSAELVTNITTETRAALREVLERSFDAADPRSVERTATVVRGVVGLNRPQAAAFERYVDQLLAGGASAEEVAKLGAKRFRELLRYRSKMIAQTELWHAGNQGQHQTWIEAGAEGTLDLQAYEREWVIAPVNPCPTCQSLDGQRRDFVTPFVADDGTSAAMPPVHPWCFCDLTLRLRDGRDG